MEAQAAIDELQRQLRRYPADRYPVQHATAQFHLGAALLGQGRAGEAGAALRTAAELFSPLPVERAKAENMLGAALRTSGDLEGAARCFSAAAAAFDAQGLLQEHAAALHNIGLVAADQGRADEAAGAFEEALRRFKSAGLPGQSAAAARELGAARLTEGDFEAALPILQEAVELADRAGDLPGVARAGNTKGLAHLALSDAEGAAEAFRAAAAASPRGLRAESYAMAKANLALAHEQAGDATRAVLAARQALAVPAPQPVVAQATAVVERLSEAAGDVIDVLDDEPRARWPAVIREELARWVDTDSGERKTAVKSWIDGQLQRPGRGADLSYGLLDALLEQPPAAMTAVVSATLEVLEFCDEEARERFRADVSRAMIRFHGPQWMRIKDTFNRLAVEGGQEPVWG